MSTILVWSGRGHARLQVCFWWDYHKEEESGMHMLLAGILKFSQLLLLFVHSTHNAA